MLLYLPTFVTGHPVVPDDGWVAAGEPFQLQASLLAAEADAVAPDGQTGRVLVLDSAELSLSRADPPAARAVPRKAVLNVDPDGDFWPPFPVDAAGGYREVSEEVGIPAASIRVVADLGATIHGYVWPRKEAFAVKTTHWYAMTTTAEAFEPEDGEGIEAVAWVPWAEAGRRLGFESLRAHHATLDENAIRLDRASGGELAG